MRRLLLLILISALTVGNTLAHNPKIATFTLRDSGIGWYLEMQMARSAVDAEMLRIYGAEMLGAIDKKAYQDLFVQYVQEHIAISQDGRTIPLETGGIRLGNHQTDLKFAMKALSEPNSLKVSINLFEEEHNQVNLFRIYRGGDSLFKIFLSEDNDFSAHLHFSKEEGVIDVQNADFTQGLSAGTIAFMVIVSMLLGLAIMMRIAERRLDVKYRGV